MFSIFSDLRYACRTLIAQPGWTLAALACLAIGTGANTATFSVINAVLLRPLPFPDSNQLVMVGVREPDRPQTRPFSVSDYRNIEPLANLFSELAARTFLPASVVADGPAQMVQTELVSSNYFAMLRITPLLGRSFQSETEAVLSERLWRARFGADPSVVGRVIRVNGRPFTVSGVAPAGFVGATSLLRADMWLPMSVYSDSETTPMFGVIGRLKPGVTPSQARAQLDVIHSQLARSRGDAAPPTAIVEAATGFGVPPVARTMVISASALLFGLIGMIIAVAIANVAGLMLARAVGRRREISVRVALGATPSRIVQQILTESIVLALGGAVAGVLLAAWLTSAFTGFGPRLPEHLSFGVDVRPDWRVLAYSAITAVMIAVMFGLTAARRAVRTDVIDALKQSGGSRRTPATSRALNTLVVGQMAVSTVLLIGAGLLVRTYLNTQAVEPGIDTRNVLAVSLDLNQAGYDSTSGRRFYDKLLARVSALQGVETASFTREAPLSPAGRPTSVWVNATAERTAGGMVVTPQYFRSLRIPLLHGREFTFLDREGTPVVVINETMAREFWPGTSPLGRTFRIGNATGPSVEVIGVARDMKYGSLAERPRPVFYRPLTQEYSPGMTLIVRSLTDPRSLIEAIRRDIQAENKDLSIVDVRTLDDQLQAATAPSRQRATILATICAIGLLLSSVGLYGVVSYGVRERAREFGLRVALGAQARDVLSMVLRQGLRLAVVGLLIGVGASLLLTRLIASVLFGVDTYDPITLGAVGCVLVAIAGAASYLPARWATRVDPMLALRSE